MMKRISVCAVALLVASVTACDLDLNDPNIPTEEAVITDPGSMIRTAVGLQAEYSDQLADPLYVTGMVTNELGANESTFESFRILHSASQPATNDFGASSAPWAGQFRVVRVADVVINNAGNVGLGPGMVSGMTALGKLYKAMALGNLIQIYERIPLDVGPNIRSPAFAERSAVLARIIALLEEANAHLQQVPASTEFRTQVLAPGFNLENTINAMLARYALIAGDLVKADAAAASVDLNVWSEFRFSATDANPLWNLAVNGGNSTSMRPRDQFRLDAEPGDGRVDYWVTEAPLEGHLNTPLDAFNRYGERTHAIPAYLPGEMLLIRAEVAARNNQLNTALGFVNQVREQCSSPHPEPLACLEPLLLSDVPTQAAMLAEILHQRRYELYLQHVRWSDLRRFGETPKYMWMPVPGTECDRNTSTPTAVCQPVPVNPGFAI